MTMINLPTAAAPRTLSVPTPPFTPSTDVAAWRRRVPSLGVAAGMREGVVLSSNHNSIPAAIRSTVVLTADAGPNAYGAAKQAAPPRGVPR